MTWLSLALMGCKPPTPAAALPAPTYPPATRGEVVDEHHGTQVADPYRWLEDPDAPESRSWIEAQNTLTRSYLDEVEALPALQQRLTALWDHERYSAPSRVGESGYVYYYNDGLQEHSALYRVAELGAEPELVLDPNTFSEDGTVSLGGTSWSDSGRYLAYSTSDGGSDWRTWRVRDLSTGEDLEDVLKWSKFSGLAWSPDESGFYYTRYPEPSSPLEDVTEGSQLYFPQLGQTQDEDSLVFDDPEHPRRGFSPAITEDGRYLLVYISEGTEDLNRIWYRDLQSDEEALQPLFDDFDASYRVLGSQGSKLWIRTNLDAPLKRIVTVDLEDPELALEEIVPESEDNLQRAALLGGQLFLSYLHDAHSKVLRYSLAGEPLGELELPGIGSVGGFSGKEDEAELFYSFSSATRPSTIYRMDIDSGEQEIFRSTEILDHDPEAYVTRQIFYESKDGTQVPMFVTHRKDLELSGDLPTLLYGYGGFNISLTPSFSVSRLVWLEMGGVYAVANLRGGGEYGEAWHQAGTQLSKQNVFDDFIRAGETLIEQGYTQPSRLAIQGGSNGGLLVGACLLQRPDLFGAALPAVGVLDMLRYHLFTIGWAWASDYGTVDDSQEMFEYLLGYSPVHNVVPGTEYPPTLITTGDHDDRVVPAHSFKFAAALQHGQAGDNPVLIRVETRGGHGAGKSTSMRIEEISDQYAFLIRSLEMTPRLAQLAESEAP